MIKEDANTLKFPLIVPLSSENHCNIDLFQNKDYIIELDLYKRKYT